MSELRLGQNIYLCPLKKQLPKEKISTFFWKFFYDCYISCNSTSYAEIKHREIEFTGHKSVIYMIFFLIFSLYRYTAVLGENTGNLNLKKIILHQLMFVDKQITR
jgi:hypothetical protein